MIRAKLFVVALSLVSATLVAYWITHPQPAGAKKTAGAVVGDWRCEILNAGNEEETASWLSRHASRGPAGVLVMEGYTYMNAELNMLCVHSEVQQRGYTSDGSIASGPEPPPPPPEAPASADTARSAAIDVYFDRCAVEDTESRRRQAVTDWDLLPAMGVDPDDIWELVHQLESGCGYISFKSAVLSMKRGDTQGER